MKIIGHRGAAGLELENTLASLRRAKSLGVDGVEFDVRLTSDRQLVLCHDADLTRISNSSAKVHELTLYELKQIKLRNGETIPTLEEALRALDGTWAIVETKVSDCVPELLGVLDKFPGKPITVASFHHDFIAELQTVRRSVSAYLAERTRPTEIIHLARTAKADGFDLNAWLLNPLTYWLAKRNGFEIMVYTINHPWIARFIHRLYPDVAICTDHPERFLPRS